MATNVKDKLVTVGGLKTAYDALNKSIGNAKMDVSVYDPQGKHTDVFKYAADISAAQSNVVQSNVDSMKTTVGNINTALTAAQAEILEAHSFSDNGATYKYDTLASAIAGVASVARAYTNTALTLHKAFTIEVVDSINFEQPGTEFTFYLVPNESGTGFDKFWWITDANTGRQMWDSFGSATTMVVNELPSVGASSVDYILNTGSGYVYYKWISGKWEIIAGSMAEVADTLPEKGNELTDYYVKNESGAYVHYRWMKGSDGEHKFVAVGSDSYTKEQIDEKIKNIVNLNNDLSQMKVNISANATNITSLNAMFDKLQAQVDGIDTEGKSYNATLTSEGDTYTFSLIETEGGEETVVSQFVLPATGGGGSNPTTTLTVEKITQSPLIITTNDTPILEIDYSSVDNDGAEVDGSYVLKMGSNKVMSGNLVQGRNKFDISEYCAVGTQKFTLTVTDDGGSVAVKTWTVQIVDIRIESAYNDRYTNLIGRDVSFTYTPYGSISKVVHFKLDGVELESVTTSASGTLQSYTIPAQTHGSHLLETWITANVSGMPVETAHIYKDIIWYDESQTKPVIGCIYRNDFYGEVAAKQYDTTIITYNVYDPTTSSPKVILKDNDKTVSENTLSDNQNAWNYKTDEIGKHTLQIICGTIVFTSDGKIDESHSRYSSVTIIVNVTELGIDVSPVSGNLEVDFNPTGITNTSANRLWSNGKYHMTVSDNFDWSNGGYKTEVVETKDSSGNVTDRRYRDYFCIKAGTRAYLDYNFFGGGLSANPSLLGAEMKIIFMTENVQDAEAVWLTNVETTTSEVDGKSVTTEVGIQMNVHNGWLKTNNALSGGETEGGVAATNTYLHMPYSEEDVIEMDINIDTIDRDASGANAFVMGYEDGVPAKAFVYNSTDRLYQYTPKPFEIGSDYCDVRIYRMKIYSTSLSTEDVMRNFIADSMDSDTMLERYRRNSIYYNNQTGEFTPYSSEGVLSPERLAEACPNIKVLKLDCPIFTKNKKTFVRGSSLECIHKAGDPLLDNWKFFNGYHSGQGTTSDNYGNSGRNVDFVFSADGKHKVSDKVAIEDGYVSYLTLGYNSESAVTYHCQDGTDINDQCRVTLTRTSFPTNYMNFKVNIASSDNANNALLQKRYNDFLPYICPAKKRDSRLKNSMEFVPAILFIRENSEEESHLEFSDTNWHFYAIGNLGDSKKTDYTRAYDPKDMNEFTIEISDNTKNNATFQSGVYLDSKGKRVVESIDDTDTHTYIYPITNDEWNANNKRYNTLYNEAFDGDHSFEPRYACCGDHRDGKLVNETHNGADAEQLKKNEGVWRAFYRWIVTSTNKQFVDELEEWVVGDAVKFFYAYTHQFTMMDNRAKNTFWHFAKTGTYRKVSRPVKELLHVYCEAVGDNETEFTVTKDTSINTGKTYYTQYAFDLWDYDNDTALGINNNGELIFPYGKEDSDYNTDGVASSGYVFNGAESTFWCRLRDLCATSIKTIYNSVSSKCWDAENLISEFDAWQDMYPEEVWRLDIRRKYLRTFTGEIVDNSIPKKDISYLRDMMQGRKKYQRRQWVRDQEVYFATKELSSSVTGSDYILFRCNTPVGDNIAVKPDYTLRITPYSDMYVSVMFGNGDVHQERAKGGQEYVIECPLDRMDDTQVVIYGASRIAALNDISACYIHANNFSMATKLRKLVIGNPTEGYNNSFLTTLNLGNNALLEELDLRNCGALSGSLDLSPCTNLLKLYAEGTSISGVTFATNGKIRIAHLPDSINTLIMRNLNDLDDFSATLSRLESLTLQGGKINSYELIQKVIDTLQVLYLYDVNWNVSTTAVLNAMAKLFFSLVTGYVYISGSSRQSELDTYASKWSDLTVEYNKEAFVVQFPLTCYNDDKSTVVFTKYCDQGGLIDISDIPTPTKEPDAQYIYTFDHWVFEDGSEVNFDTYRVTGNINIYAHYTTETRTYTVKWISYANTVVDSQQVKYGSSAVFNGTEPTRTDGESSFIFYLFDGWDKNTGYITGDTVVNAKWQVSNGLPPEGTKPKDMTAVQLYAVCQAGLAASYFDTKDYIEVTMGHDVDYENVKSVVLAENLKLNGSNYLDTKIKLFDEDKDWTIMIDYSFDDPKTNETLLSCYNMDGNDGVEIIYNGGAKPRFGATTHGECMGIGTFRNVMVLRHTKGDNLIRAYAFEPSKSTGEDSGQLVGLYSDGYGYAFIPRQIKTETDATIILGARKDYTDGSFINNAKATIYKAKLWYADLGEDECYKLVSWTHETHKFEYYGNKIYRLSASGYANASFIMKDLLERRYQMNKTNDNTGGWDTCIMRTFLNNKFYKGLPDLFRRLLKQVRVKASAGNQSYEITTSNDFVYLAANMEVGGWTTEPYANECEYKIPWFTTNASRLKFFNREVPEDAKFYTSAKNVDPTLDNDVKNGDIWIQSDNDSRGFIYADGKWIQAYWYWERSALASNSALFLSVYTGGYPYYGYGASGTNGVCPCLSI